MSILQSYILYYFIIISSTILVLLSKKLDFKRTQNIHKAIFWSALILPVIISAFRYGIGTDYFSYENSYYIINSYNSIIDSIINTRYEPGWVVLNYLVGFVFNDVRYIFVFSSILIWLFYFKAIYNQKKRVSIVVAVLILLCTMYNLSFNNIRQSIAISILLLSIKPIIDKKPWKFLLVSMFSICFHYTALVFLPAYWIVNSNSHNVNLAKKTISVILIVALIFMIQPLLSFLTTFEIFSSYSDYQVKLDNNIGVGNLIVKAPIIAILLFNAKKLRLAGNSMSRMVFLYFIGIILEFLGYIIPFGGRISIYFEATQIFILSAIVKTQKNKYEKLIYTLVIVSYFIGLFTYRIIILNYNQTIPYIWN